MTKDERIELLKEVARVAPKEMEAGLTKGLLVDYKVHIHASNCALYMDPDFKDGDACFAMLDAMEMAEGFTAPGLQKDGDGYSCNTGYIKTVSDANSQYGTPYASTSFVRIEGFGSTRAEAVARAFVAVFGKLKGPAPTAEAEKHDAGPQTEGRIPE